jgi:hypothetical protein
MQEDLKFKSSLVYIARPHLKYKNKKEYVAPPQCYSLFICLFYSIGSKSKALHYTMIFLKNYS